MAPLPRVGDTFGRYRIEDRLGQGGMGVVFGATDLALGRRVALKVVSGALAGEPALLQRFRREASLLARLDSPHVVDVFDHGVHDGCPYIATRYVAGGDLGALLRARGAMPPRLAARVCAQVADALDDAHRAGVVHRDVKPGNVLLQHPDADDVHAYLCDFGVARGESDGLTVPGAVTGTWGYLAPECGRGASGSPASDVYALGCLFWSALTGAPPYRGSDVEVAVAHQQAPVPRLKGGDAFTRAANRILRRSMAKRPGDRYADVAALRTDLLAAAEIESGDPRMRRGRAGLTVGLLVAVLILGGGAFAGSRFVGAAGPDEEPGRAATGSDGGPVTGDLDGDGYGDLSARMAPPAGPGGHGTPTLTTWRSDGVTLTRRETTPDGTPGGNGSRTRVPGDFDGDGRLDVLVSDEVPGSGEPRLHGVLSGGARLDQNLRRSTRQGVGALYGQDVDGDGLDDLVVWSRDGERMVLETALGDGAGFGPPAQAADLPLPDYVNVEVGDLDGDGRADLAVLGTGRGAGAQSRLQVHLGDGSAFRPRRPAHKLDTGPQPRMEVGDFDGDGDDELLLVSFPADGSAALWVSDQDAAAGRPEPRGALEGSRGPARLAGIGIADVDGDGRDDVVHVDPARRTGPGLSVVTVARSEGAGFAAPVRWGSWPARMAPGYLPQLLGNTIP